MATPGGFTQNLDIVDVIGEYVPLTRKGNSFWGLCPFHAEKAPSFSVSKDKQIYHCFGCGKEGGVISFVMEMEHLSYPDAVRHLAKRIEMKAPESTPASAQMKSQSKISPQPPYVRIYQYKNLRSALAEEGVLRLLLMEPTLFDRIDLTPEEFSSKLLGRVYDLWQRFYTHGLRISLSSLAGTLNEREMDHIAQVLSIPEPLLNATETIENYIRIIREEGPSRPVKTGPRRIQ